MIIVEDYEAIRRAYSLEKQSIRLTGKGHILEFIGESYRFRQRLRQEEQPIEEQAETG
jgi:hypothetical protein